MTCAVIDLGSNTFHLLVGRYDNSLRIIHKERIYVHLGAGGLGELSIDAMIRGVQALSIFKKSITAFQVDKIICLGTAALRAAHNAVHFIEEIRSSLGLDIQIIDGDQEASFIYKGVALIHPFTEQASLIMDIGGGSVEFIIANDQNVCWKRSYNVGILELYNTFHKNDPYDDSNLERLVEFLMQTFSDLREQCRLYQVISLIGASGTFDVLANVTGTSDLITSVDFKVVDVLYEKTKNRPLAERLALEEIPNARAQYIVEALSLIQAVRSIHEFQTLQVSKYALKEGAMAHLLNI